MSEETAVYEQTVDYQLREQVMRELTNVTNEIQRRNGNIDHLIRQRDALREVMRRFAHEDVEDTASSIRRMTNERLRAPITGQPLTQQQRLEILLRRYRR